MSTHRIALRESVSEIVGAMRFVGSSNDIYALSFLSSTSDRSIFLPRKGCHSSFGIYPRRSEIAYVRNADGWIEEKIGGSIFIRFALLALYIFIYTLRTFPERTREFERKIGKRIRRSFVAPTFNALSFNLDYYSRLFPIIAPSQISFQIMGEGIYRKISSYSSPFSARIRSF